MKIRSVVQMMTFALVVANISNMQAADTTKSVRFEKKSNGYSSYIEAIDNKNHEFVGNISYSVPLCSIDYVWVIEKMRSKGIGSNLFKQAVNDMSNCEYIKQTVNPTTVDFCLKQGARIENQAILEKADPIWWAPSVHMIFDNKQQRQ